jgi:flagellar biosynthesis anti-sigma factor FlgM
MKINPLINAGAIQSYKGQNKKAGKVQTTFQGQGDQVSFSEDALSFSRLMKQMKEVVTTEDSEVRASRLEAIKAGIEDGSYRVSSDVLADSILRAIVGS